MNIPNVNVNCGICGKNIVIFRSGLITAKMLLELSKTELFFNGDKTKVNLYHFDKEESSLNSIEEELTVKDGYIEFDIKHCSEYFVTRSNLGVIQNNNYLIGIIAIVELITIITIIVLDILKINPLLKLKKDTAKKTSKQ